MCTREESAGIRPDHTQQARADGGKKCSTNSLSLLAPFGLLSARQAAFVKGVTRDSCTSTMLMSAQWAQTLSCQPRPTDVQATGKEENSPMMICAESLHSALLKAVCPSSRPSSLRRRGNDSLCPKGSATPMMGSRLLKPPFSVALHYGRPESCSCSEALLRLNESLT